MNPPAFIQPLVRLWRRLTEPAASVQNLEDRRQAQLLAGLLLVVLAVTVIILPARYLANAASPYTLVRLLAVMLGAGAILAAYRLARQGRHHRASQLVAVLGTGVIFFTSLSVAPEIGVGTLYYLTVIMLFASQFLSLRLTVALALAQLAAMLLLPVIRPAYTIVPILEGPAPFNLLITLLAVIFAHYRQRLEYERRAQLESSERRYRIISELVSDYAYSFRVEPNGKLTLEWSTTSNQTHIERALIVHHSTGLPALEDSGSMELDLLAILKGEARGGDYRVKTDDGDVRWLHIYRRPEWDAAQERVTRIYGVAQDITERKAAEKARIRQAVERERLKLVGGFVEAVQHDFRTSLTNIENSRYLLERTLPQNHVASAQKRLDSIRQAVEHLTRQIENLQVVSSLIAPQTRPCALEPLIERLVARSLPTAQQYGVALDFTIDAPLPPVLADGDELGRALQHLLDNALNHTPAGGQVMVQAHTSTDMVYIAVHDSGEGIAPEHTRHIFDPFYRVDPARSLESGGVGLGLSIARLVAEAHNGKLTVASAPGHGSTFTLALPALAPAKPPAV